MKEMVGGCCVCSDERGWPENPLVYCDGQNCTVAVHQACYGIVNVPTGPWYCRKCESQERSARVRCELCPSRDGALKKTDNQGWAHVVCALYIPEVRFGNVTTMEPILLELIPPERYAKTCYICQEIGKGNRANVGACMQCNKSGCKQQFHVTCAQSLGLLCEEAGNYLDNVKYCGYCQHHYSKLVQSKKGGNVKTIPPYKPITHETGSSDSQSSPEKELEPPVSASTSNVSTTLKISSNQNLNTSTTSTSSTSSSSSSKQRKSSSTSKLASSSSSSTSNTAGSGSGSGSGVNAASSSSSTSSSSKNSSSSSSSSKDKEKHSKSLSKISSSSKCQDKESTSSSSSSSTRDKSKSSKSSKDSGDHSSMSSISIGSNNPMINVSSSLSSTMSSASKETIGQKFTTSNFTESVVVNSESVFGANDPPPTSSSSSKTSSSSSSAAKKRKADTIKLSGSTDPVEINNSLRDIIKDVSVTLIPLPIDKPESMDIDKLTSKKPKTESNSSPMHLTHEPNLQNVSPNLMNSQGSSGSITIKQSAPTSSQQAGASNNSSSSHIKGPMLKEESRLRSSPSYNSTTAGLSGSNPSTPSLYVSVPLSTATVPGVNLPSTTSNASDLVTQSQSSRSSPLVSQHHSHHHSSGGIGSNHQSGIERQSPRIHQSQGLSAPSSLLSDHNTSSCSSQSSTIGAVSQANTSPSVGTAAAVGPGSTASPMDTGTLKITYEKQNMRISQLQEQEQAPARRSRTPDSGNFSSTNSSINSTSLNNGGLKFTYESQIGNNVPSISPSVDTSQPPVVKESPPSSPGSEAGSARKRSRKSVELKDIKVFHNGVHATHMLGNQLNPASSVAQKMSDQLHMEIQDHSVYTQSAVDAGPQVVGVPFPGKHSGVRNQSQPSAGANSLTSMLGGTGSSGSSGNTPQSLEQLLERQWEQGSQFLMEQAQHFDIASLLSCLHQLQNENGRLEDHVKNLKARRDHLLAVNARLAIPLTTNAGQGQATLNNMHMNGPTTDASSARLPRANAHYNAQQQMPMENGIDFRHTSHQSTTTSTTIRHSSTHSNFSSSTSSTHSHHSVLSSSSNRQHQQSISGSSSVSSQQSQPEQLLRSRGSSLSNQSNSSGNNLGPGGGGGVSGSGGGGGGGTSAGGVGGGGSGSAYHSSTQQSAYSTVHQSQLRRDDSQGKPS